MFTHPVSTSWKKVFIWACVDCKQHQILSSCFTRSFKFDRYESRNLFCLHHKRFPKRPNCSCQKEMGTFGEMRLSLSQLPTQHSQQIPPSQHQTVTPLLEVGCSISIKAVRVELLRRARQKQILSCDAFKTQVFLGARSVVATPWRRAVCQQQSVTFHSHFWSPTFPLTRDNMEATILY